MLKQEKKIGMELFGISYIMFTCKAVLRLEHAKFHAVIFTRVSEKWSRHLLRFSFVGSPALSRPVPRCALFGHMPGPQ